MEWNCVYNRLKYMVAPSSGILAKNSPPVSFLIKKSEAPYSSIYVKRPWNHHSVKYIRYFNKYLLFLI